MYKITSEQLDRIGRVHLLLAREIIANNPTKSDQKFHMDIGKIIASVNLLDDNTCTNLKETIINDLKLLQQR